MFGRNLQSKVKTGRTGSDTDENNTPMLAVFGGMFAVMLVFLVLVNVVSEAAVRERLLDGADEGMYRISRMDGGEGFVVLTFPDSLRIVETGEGVGLKDICAAGSAYREYADSIYSRENAQIVFVVLEGSVPLMAEARNCLRIMFPDVPLHIGWVMADAEFLKSVVLDDIPPYIQDYAQRNRIIR